jgi:hypothetical protein
MNVTPTQVLERMLEIYSGSEKWTQKYEARSATGQAVSALDRTAVCYCVIGAATRAYYDLMGTDIVLTYSPVDEALELVSEESGSPIVLWNDTVGRTFDEVRTAIEQAYELSKQEA